MLAKIVGNVDIYSAAVLCFLSIAICIIVTTMIAKRRSRVDISNEFELAKIKLHDEKEATQYKLETDRSTKFKQLDQNLITSHKVED